MDANTTNVAQPARRRLRLTAAALGSAAVIGLAVGLSPLDGIGATSAADKQAVTPTQPVQAWSGYADLIEQVMPSVVGITAKRAMSEEMARNEGGPRFGAPFPEGPDAEAFKRFMERFFGERGFGQEFGERDFGPEMPPHGFQAPVAAGSGFIVSADGLVVTNNHVIDGASEVTVKLHDGKEVEATVVGRDPDTDLALLRIKSGENLQPVTFADASKVRVGDPVVAIGSPFGLGGTVTAGIVSADDRAIGAGRYDDFLQIDAAINRGNSGGPTFNLEGEVIGVNTLIHSPSGGNVGIGFAIPSDLVQRIVADLGDDGRIERGWLGVQIQSVDDDLAESLGLQESKGALVAAVTDDSPAAEAGFEQGDVIVTYDGQAIENLRDLTRAVADTEPGKSAEVVVVRGGSEQTLEVEIGQMPMEDQQVAAATEQDDGTPKLGLALAQLTQEARQQLQLDTNVNGVVITNVMPGSPAAEKGLQAGDVIVEADRSAVKEPQAVVDAVKKVSERGDEAILLLVKREGQNRYVAVPLQRA